MRRTFLVLDQRSERSSVITHALGGKFPGAQLLHCAEPGAASNLLARHSVDAVVVYATTQPADIVRAIRPASAKAPIVTVSACEYAQASIDAGAASFLPFDAAFMLGSVVADLICRRGAAAVAA